MKRADLSVGLPVRWEMTHEYWHGVVVRVRARNQYMTPEEPDRVEVRTDAGKTLFLRPRELQREQP